MAFTTTTLAGALAIDQNTISVTSATGFSAGMLAKIDDEIVEIASDYVSGTSIGVLRGREGTATVAHPTGANIVVGLGSDFVNGAPQTTSAAPIAARARPVKSYTASGALDLPTPGNDLVCILNGTSVRAMTLAVPTKDMDGCELIIIGNGKAAHTVTHATAMGNAGAGYTVNTFAAGGQVGVRFIAANGIWVAPGAPAFAGTNTALLATTS